VPDNLPPRAFRELVEREMTALGYVPGEWDGRQLKYRTADGKEQELGTGNLLKRVKLNDPDDAPGIVREFVTNISAVAAPEWKLPETLEECPDRILPRIGQPFTAGGPVPWSLPMPGTDELVVNLVIDFPTTMAYVTPDLLAKSATPPEVWLDRAITNLKALTKPEWLTPHQPEDGIVACHTNDSYDAARALLLCERTGNDPAGWLVAVPARDWLFARKVDMSGVAHFHHLKTLANKAKREQPYPISDTVFWLRPGQPWQEFKIEFEGKKVTIHPSAEFVEVLNGLVAAGG
jgi:hypothetical protein